MILIRKVIITLSNLNLMEANMIYKIFLIHAFTLFLSSQTSDQIKEAKQFIEKSGINESQARDMARERGYSDEKINKLIKEEKLKEKSNQGNNDQNKNYNNNYSDIIDGANPPTDLKDQKQKEEEKNSLTDLKNQEKTLSKPELRTNYYGYEIFKRDPSFFQATGVGSVEPTYTIGAGDEIILMLWGETQFRQVLKVNREGFIFIPEIGQVFVNGLNLNLLESKLFKVLSKSYGSLNPQSDKASTFLDVSLGNLRPLRIQVLGEVDQPGSYTVSPSATLFSSLYYFNGPTHLGSLRDIKLIRGGQEITSIDFYDYLQTGKKPKDEQLQIDDVIFIPKRKNTIEIIGEVNRPSIYELDENESLTSLIKIAGGLKVTAHLEHAQVDRVVPFNERSILLKDRVLVDLSLKKIINEKIIFKLKDGDKISISSIFEERGNVVNIQGSISRPGDYNLEDSIGLNELILKAGGLNGDAYMDRIDVIRTNSDYSETLIKLDLAKVISGEIENNFSLSSADRVLVYSEFEMNDYKSVILSGHIKKPGRYKLRKNMKLYDLLFMGGGLIGGSSDLLFFRNTFLERADLLRYDKDGINKTIKPFNLGLVLGDKESENNFELLSGDEIRIYSKEVFNKTRSVSIDGSINKPGSYELKKNMTILDLILEAGGVKEDVYKYKIEISRINLLERDIDKYAELINLEMFNDYSISSNTMKKKKNNFKLEPYDVISVRADPYFSLPQKVDIKGEVLYPGIYSLLTPSETIYALIERAGGLSSNAQKHSSILIRDKKTIRIDLNKILEKSNSKFDLNIQDGDIIIIEKKSGMIEILGEVKSPGLYSYMKDIKVKEALKRAGGFTLDYERKDIVIRFPNGRSERYNTFFNNPKLIDGSKILVGKEKESEPFDSTEYAKELTAILASLAQVFSLIILTRS